MTGNNSTSELYTEALYKCLICTLKANSKQSLWFHLRYQYQNLQTYFFPHLNCNSNDYSLYCFRNVVPEKNCVNTLCNISVGTKRLIRKKKQWAEALPHFSYNSFSSHLPFSSYPRTHTSPSPNPLHWSGTKTAVGITLAAGFSREHTQ